MKLNIFLKLRKGYSSIPEKYQHYMACDINDCTVDIAKKGSLLYSFSQLVGTKRLDNGCFIPKDEFVWFEFSSPDVALFNDILKNIFIKRYMVNDILEVSHVEYIDEEFEKCNSNYAFFSSLSPITLYDKLGDKRIYYIPSMEETVFRNGQAYEIVYDTTKCINKMKSIIVHNLKKCNIDVTEYDFDLEIVHTYKHKNYVAKMDNDKVIRTFGFFAYVKITASTSILSFISDLGLGNSLGLGFGHIKRNK